MLKVGSHLKINIILSTNSPAEFNWSLMARKRFRISCGKVEREHIDK